MATSPIKQGTLESKTMKKKMSKAQMQVAILKKKKCDAKALTIVEHLLEPKIDCQWLLDNLKYINKSHMEDVIEERGIIKLCGYVLCDNALTTIIEQQYHISTKNNKVYDVSKRKNFCSSQCYGACNYLLHQMLTSPLWLRDKEEIPVFKILSAKDELKRSIPGEEIYLNDTTVMFNSNNKHESAEVDAKCEDLNDVTLNTETKSCIEYNIEESSQTVNQSNNETSNVLKEHYLKNFNKEFENTRNIFIDSIHMTDTVKQCINDDSDISVLKNNIVLHCSPTKNTKTLSDTISVNNDANHYLQNNTKQNSLIITKHNTNISNDNLQESNKSKQNEHKYKNIVKEKKVIEFYNLAMHIEHSVKEWITEDTLFLLSGKEDIKNRLLENIVQHNRYVHLCKKLSKLQLEDEKNDCTNLTKSILKPLPHLSVLEEEGKKMELKVRAYYKGSMIIENHTDVIEDTKEVNDFASVLPLTDAHAPKALRRRIFLDKLNRILPDLLRALASNKLPQYTYSNERSILVKALVNTFSLTATNIIFKTAEWTLVGLVIIKMLSMIDSQLKFLLSSKQASMYISMILMSYKLDSNYLDRLVMELTNDIEISNIANATNV